MENLNKCSMRSPICTESKDTSRCENQSHRLRSKCNHQRNNLLTDQRRRYKRKKRDMLVDKIYSEHVDKPLINIIKSGKKQVKKLKEKFEYSSEPNEDKEEENVQNESCNLSELFMSDKNNVHNQNDNPVSPNFLALESSKENLYNEPKIYNGTEGNEFRMNCSITEHQMLDKNYFKSTTCCCGSDIENISVHSDLSSNTEICDDYNEFELISMPMKYKTNTNCHKPRCLSKNENIKNIVCKEDNDNDIVTDILNFDLLPEISPASSVICIAENHFTANSNNTLTPITKKDLNNVSIHKPDEKEDSNNEDNINKKIHDTHLSNTSKKCMNNNSTDLTDNICSLLIKSTLKSIDENTNLLHLKSEHNNTNAMKIDVNSSHTSYLTEPINTIYSDLPIAQHSCQAQTDLNDLTQSFHSHTTSITDNGIYGISETNTSNSHDYSKHNFSDSNTPIPSKKNRICEQVKKDLNNKYLEKNSTKEESKNGHIIEKTTTNSMPGTAEPIHILPETLVTGAFHFASIAYGTAREAFVRIRSTSVIVYYEFLYQYC